MNQTDDDTVAEIEHLLDQIETLHVEIEQDRQHLKDAVDLCMAKAVEVGRLQRENGSLARTYAACEQMLRERTGLLNDANAENEWLRAELARWKPTRCGAIYPVPVPGEVVEYCIRESDHGGPHQAESGMVWGVC